MLKTDLNVVCGELPPACIDKVFNAEASPVGMAGSNDRGEEGSVKPIHDTVKLGTDRKRGRPHLLPALQLIQLYLPTALKTLST
jgi:hypothetical protein